MIDIVNLFNKITNRFNDENKCGQCWEFHAPMREDQINVVKTNNPCCVQLILTNYRFNIPQLTNTQTGLDSRRYIDHSFNLYVLKQSNAGIQNFNEIKEYDPNTSKWATIHFPLAQCLNDSNSLRICELTSSNVIVTNWGAFTQIINYQAMNYDGWLIPVTIREYEND